MWPYLWSCQCLPVRCFPSSRAEEVPKVRWRRIPSGSFSKLGSRRRAQDRSWSGGFTTPTGRVTERWVVCLQYRADLPHYYKKRRGLFCISWWKQIRVCKYIGAKTTDIFHQLGTGNLITIAIQVCLRFN